MYGHPQAMRLQQQQRQSEAKSKPKGVNRRTIALLPGERFSQAKLLLSPKMTVLHQLLNIEAQRLTCCLKIESPKFKSRAGLLILRGEVLACLYGCTNMQGQLFGRAAHERLMSEITQPGNLFDGYLLSEEMALAAGSMFHNQVVSAPANSAELEAFQAMIARFDQANVPGTVAFLSGRGGPLCLTYFSRRKLIGAQSFCDEVNLSNLSAVMRYLERHPGSQILGSMMNFERCQSIRDLTFSLSGLNSEKTDIVRDKETGEQAADLVLLQSVKQQNPRIIVPGTQFVNSQRSGPKAVSQQIIVDNVFQVHPEYPGRFQ